MTFEYAKVGSTQWGYLGIVVDVEQYVGSTSSTIQTGDEFPGCSLILEIFTEYPSLQKTLQLFRVLAQIDEVSCTQTWLMVWYFTKYCHYLIFIIGSLCTFTTNEGWSVLLCAYSTCVCSFQARICFPSKTFCCENHIIMDLSSFMMLTMIICLMLSINCLYLVMKPWFVDTWKAKYHLQWHVNKKWNPDFYFSRGKYFGKKRRRKHTVIQKVFLNGIFNFSRLLNWLNMKKISQTTEKYPAMMDR